MYSRQQVPMCALFRPFAAPVRRSPSGGGEAGLGPDPGVWKKGRQPSAPGLCPPVAGKAPACRADVSFPAPMPPGSRDFPGRRARRSEIPGAWAWGNMQICCLCPLCAPVAHRRNAKGPVALCRGASKGRLEGRMDLRPVGAFAPLVRRKPAG